MDYIKHLEEVRERKGMSKTDMAKLFNVTWQTYHNWTARESLPKDHVETARRILIELGGTTAIRDEINELLDGLSDDALRAALNSIGGIHDLDQKS